jgi:hypothetical protein
MRNIPNFFYEQNFKKIFVEDKYLSDRKISALQLGAWVGISSVWMIKNFASTLVDVDMFSRAAYDNHPEDLNLKWVAEELFFAEKEYLKNTKNLKNISLFKGSTEKFFQQNTQTFDFIYIDASHDKKDVTFDADQSFLILNPGGIMAFDDFLWYYGKDQELIPHIAILEFLIKYYGKIKILLMNDQVWIQKLYQS